MASEGNKAPAIGIDIGTTYSRVAVWHCSRVEIILNHYGSNSTPSCVAFTEDEMLVGEAAMNQIDMNPANTVLGVEGLIGKSFETVRNEIKLWRPFKLVAGSKGRLKIVVKYYGIERQFYVEQILSMILATMKKHAEDYFECTINRAVITVPAYFNNLQRQATKDAGTIAGLNIVHIIDEPIAAAIAYDYFDKITEDNKLLVFDIGYGTCDVSLLSIRNGNFMVTATVGDAHLGGDDFHECLVRFCVKEFKRTYNEDITRNMKSLRRLRSACERAKRNLSETVYTTIGVDNLYDGIDFTTQISRTLFEEFNMNLFMKFINLIERCLSDAKIDKTGVDLVVLIGNSTRIPKMQQLLQDFFKGKKICKGIHPVETVAYGAAIKAAKLNGQLEYGAFVGAPPLSLGVGTLGGRMTVVVPRNTPVPTEKHYVLTTTIDDQTNTALPIYEGENDENKYNNLLGYFGLYGIDAAPKGIPQIDVCFHIDADGILNVSAKDRSSGRKNEILIGKGNGVLTLEGIESLGEAAVCYKAEQERKAAMVSLKDYACRVKAMAKDPGISASEKKSMEVAAENVIEWLDRNHHATVDEINKRQGELETTMRRLMKLKRGGIPYDQVLLLSRGA